MGLCHVGPKWGFRGKDFASRSHLPEWFMMSAIRTIKGDAKFGGIAVFGIAATIIAETAISTLPRNIRIYVNICIDNNAAIRAVIPRNGKNEIRAKSSQIFRRPNLLANAIFWFEFVPFASNSGDLHPP